VRPVHALGEVGSAGFADHEPGGERPAAGGQGGIGDAFEYGSQGDGGDIPARLVNGRELGEIKVAYRASSKPTTRTSRGTLTRADSSERSSSAAV